MDKISFTPLNEENERELPTILSGGNDAVREEIEYIKNGFLSYICDEDIECAFSLSFGCLAVRIFDMGRYFFPFPFEIGGISDIKEAIKSVVFYCMKEEIPAVFTDVPSEGLSCFADIGYKHMDIRREGALCDEVSYRVRLVTECAELDEIPMLLGDRLALCELNPSDVQVYARICRDESVISLWGYDYREDMPYAADSDFFMNTKLELERGATLTLGVKLLGEKKQITDKDEKSTDLPRTPYRVSTDSGAEGILIGEAVFYAFDALGGADIAFRILPEYRGCGYGKELLSLIFEYARGIGLDRLMADVMNKNTASKHLLSKEMDIISENRDITRYQLLLS